MTVIDLTGQVFGRWTVIARATDRASSDSKGARWSCRCVCGTVRTVRGHNLRHGFSSSCGCIAADIGRAYWERARP